MALSLFGGKKHLHHFVAEQDVAKELFALLVEAKTMYLRDVVTGNKQYYQIGRASCRERVLRLV